MTSASIEVDLVTTDVVVAKAVTDLDIHADTPGLTFGVPGPAGPPGPAGGQGPKGDTGATGAASTVPGPAGPQGPTFLTGTGAPLLATGANGEYYLDTDADVLYGPKAPVGVPEPPIDPITIVSTVNSGPLTYGMKYRFVVPGAVTGIAVRPHATTITMTNWVVLLWDKATQAELARATATGLVAGQFNQVPFTSSVSVSAGKTYVVGLFLSTGSDRVGQDYASAAVMDVGNVHLCSDGEDGSSGSYSTAGTATFPDTDYNKYRSPISPLFLASDPWPVAIRGDTAPVATMTQAAYDALAFKDPSTVYVVT